MHSLSDAVADVAVDKPPLQLPIPVALNKFVHSGFTVSVLCHDSSADVLYYSAE